VIEFKNLNTTMEFNMDCELWFPVRVNSWEARLRAASEDIENLERILEKEADDKFMLYQIAYEGVDHYVCR